MDRIIEQIDEINKILYSSVSRGGEMFKSPIMGLGYLVVGTQETDDWQIFARDLLGMMPSKLPLPEGSFGFRMDDRMARIIVERGEDQVIAIGWDVKGSVEWEELMKSLGKAKIVGKMLSQEESRQRSADLVYRVTDPSGQTVEFALRPLRDSIDRFVSPIGVRFVTGDQGMGHVTMAVSNFAGSVDFYQNVLNFDFRETLDTPHIRASVFSPNPRQHSIFIIDGHGQNHFHHVMVEVDTIDDVGRCLDKVMDGEAVLTVGLGRHFNDKMTSFYMKSPSSLQVEYGFAGLRVESGSWVENTQGGVGGASLWGHRPVADVHDATVAKSFTRIEKN